MERFLTIMIYIFPIVLILELYIYYKQSKRKKIYWTILDLSMAVLLGLSIGISTSAYGHMSMINMIAFVISCSWWLYKDFWIKSLLDVIFDCLMIAYVLYSIYIRLQNNNILNNPCLNWIKKTSVFETFLSLTQNKQFENIAIASLGASCIIQI